MTENAASVIQTSLWGNVYCCELCLCHASLSEAKLSARLNIHPNNPWKVRPVVWGKHA